jgi:hypothetical protein
MAEMQLEPVVAIAQRKVSSRGGSQVARQRTQTGFSRASRPSLSLGDSALRIIDQHGELITTVPRAGGAEISLFKAYGTRQER